MTTDSHELILGRLIEELPKSLLPAGSALFGGKYPFFCSSPEILTIDDAIAEGDTVLMGTGGDATVHLGQKAFSYSTDTWAFRSKTDDLATRYLWRWLQYNLPWISYHCFHGTGLKHLQKDDVRAAVIQAPRIAEQSRIFTVLDIVDEAIVKTKEVIAKLKQVRTGMLHDFLTHGLDEHGQLRDPIAHPKQFKDSLLGRIPREWDVDTLVSRISLPQGQVDPRLSPYCNWTLVAPDHIESETGRLIAKQTATEQGAISGKYIFEAGNVVYSKIRPYLCKAVLVDEQGLCSADMYPLRPNPGVNSRFLLAVILGEPFSRFASAVSMRSGFPKINRTELAEYVMAWPNSDEQKRIASQLMVIDEDQTTVEREHNKLQLLKSGLMADLLTGCVRVPESLFSSEGTLKLGGTNS